MIVSTLLAAALTFTATATGVDKNTPVEFLFVGRDSDRQYEAMFVLDETVTDFCNRLEKAGLPRGRPTDISQCRLWPVGCPVEFDPPFGRSVSSSSPEGHPPAQFVYTGGRRTEKGDCQSDSEMPAAVASFYTLAQSPFVLNGIFDQGAVYGSFKAAETLKKGDRASFSVRWDPSQNPRHLDLTVRPGNAKELVQTLKEASAQGELDVTVGFDGELTVSEATAVATMLSSVDSTRVKLNGCSNIFYRAFAPMVRWLDRQERVQQPFELTLEKDGSEKLLFIEEDWNVEGDDPKLTPKEISFDAAALHDKTDTCFIFADKNEKVARVLSVMKKLQTSKIRNWYVFSR